MVSIKRLKKGEKVYYYLEHSVREGSRVYKKRKYLGKKIPSNIARLRADLIEGIYEESWYGEFGKIRKCYKRSLGKMPRTIREKNMEAFMVRFTYDTQRIEGSRLSLPDTNNLLTRHLAPKNARLDDIKEADRHKQVFYLMVNEESDLSFKLVLAWHLRLFEETKPDVAGKVRKDPVIFGVDLMGVKPEKLDDALEAFFDWYGRERNEINPIKLAALVHLKFVTVHPFGDGNGRISRLMMNFVLNKFGYPMIDIKYESRQGYYNALKRSQVKNDEAAFVEWFFKRYLKANKVYLKC